jgi:hypothetical protein
MEQACDPGGVRCSEQFADLLTRRAPPNEFLLEAAAGPASRCSSHFSRVPQMAVASS